MGDWCKEKVEKKLPTNWDRSRLKHISSTSLLVSRRDLYHQFHLKKRQEKVTPMAFSWTWIINTQPQYYMVLVERYIESAPQTISVCIQARQRSYLYTHAHSHTYAYSILCCKHKHIHKQTHSLTSNFGFNIYDKVYIPLWYGFSIKVKYARLGQGGQWAR